MKNGILLLLLTIFISGCVENTIEATGDNVEKISFETEDGVTIIGNYLQGNENAVLLLHMMPSTKESWNNFAEALAKEGVSVLAIDLRGHGESNKGMDFNLFNDEEHQASIKDVEGAVNFLKNKGATSVNIVGASIGANLALQYQAEHEEIEKSVLMSPGLDYHGIKTEPLSQEIQETQKVFILAGTQDPDALEAAQTLPSLIKGEKKVKTYENSAHGTDLFDIDNNLITELINWL